MNVAKYLKSVLLSVALLPLFFVAAVTVDSVSETLGFDTQFANEANAQQQEKKRKTRKLPGITPAMMKRLAKVQELVSPDTEKNPNAKPNYPATIKELKSLEKFCSKKCNDYEKAQVYRFYAFAYYSLDDFPNAIKSYKNVYKMSPNIPIAVELDALNSLSQLSFAQEKYNDALKYLDLWMELSTIVGADKYFLRASIKYQKGDKRGALTDANKAISMREKKGKIAKEGWYNLQLAMNLEKEDYKTSKKIIEKLVVHYPKSKWWVQYANINGMLGSEKKQLGSLDAVHVMGSLDKGRDIINTAYLYLGEDVPYKAAKVLEKGIKTKKVERNVKYMKILSNAWRAARETKKAIAVAKETVPVARAADKKNKGKKKYQPEEGNIHAELVGLYLDVDDSKSAISSGKDALKAGNLKKECEVHTNMGIAYVDLQQYKSAIGAFKKARTDKQCRAFVNNWIRYAEAEQKQKEALSDS